jgi:hypothetical protein
MLFFQSETEKSLTDKTSAFTESCLLMFFERKENSKYFLPSNENTYLILETNCFIFTEVRGVFFVYKAKLVSFQAATLNEESDWMCVG